MLWTARGCRSCVGQTGGLPLRVRVGRYERSSSASVRTSAYQPRSLAAVGERSYGWWCTVRERTAQGYSAAGNGRFEGSRAVQAERRRARIDTSRPPGVPEPTVRSPRLRARAAATCGCVGESRRTMDLSAPGRRPVRPGHRRASRRETGTRRGPPVLYPRPAPRPAARRGDHRPGRLLPTSPQRTAPRRSSRQRPVREQADRGRPRPVHGTTTADARPPFFCRGREPRQSESGLSSRPDAPSRP